MTRRVVVALLLVCSVLLLAPGTARASEILAIDLDCKESPNLDIPGQGLSAFFVNPPEPLPPARDPFAPGATTTIYEQYGYAGLRWHTYDLGCGPDAARNPDAIIGTALSNWIMNLPIAFSSLTTSITETAFEPTFLGVFDPTIRRVSTALHDSLFATWVPAVIALLGIAILLRSRRAALSTTAAAIGWALMVVLVATAIFRWPIAAGHFADDTVTTTLGTVAGGVNERGSAGNPGVMVASSVQESIFYNSWLAGELGSTDSATAKEYGPQLFEAQALTWREAAILEADPTRGAQIIEEKRDRFGQIAGEIKDSDPAAYEHLTGKRSDTRLGYAILSTLGALLALPFLLVSSLLLLGSFLVVRLAVMLFPAFATLGVLPAGRGVVLGVGRTVGAALVNAVVFGIGAAVTIRVIGLIMDPASGLPGWLALVLMPLFSFVMWVALKPFRRLTSMIGSGDPFHDAAGSVGSAGRASRRWLAKAGTTAAASAAGNVAAGAAGAAAAGSVAAGDREPMVPDRAESRSSPSFDRVPEPVATVAARVPLGLPVASRPPADGPSLPVEAEWLDGEEVFAIYRPSEDRDRSHDAA